MNLQQAYAVLGLREGATEEEIKNAYRALAQQYNPEQSTDESDRARAQEKMNELNEAFDMLMSCLRTGNCGQQAETGPTFDASEPAGQNNAQYRIIRQMINSGDVDNALARLNAIPNGSADAEWNFLMGSAYYYKGWLAQALSYFQIACRLAPGNPEYAAALRNLQNSANGAMPGNPYGNQSPYGAQAVSCSCCDMCMAMMCMDACCSCGGMGC